MEQACPVRVPGQSPLVAAVAQRVRQLRRRQGMSASHLAELCEETAPTLTRSTIAKIESGIRSGITIDELVALAAALGVSTEELLAPGRSASRAGEHRQGAPQRMADALGLEGYRREEFISAALDLVHEEEDPLLRAEPSGDCIGGGA